MSKLIDTTDHSDFNKMIHRHTGFHDDELIQEIIVPEENLCYPLPPPGVPRDDTSLGYYTNPKIDKIPDRVIFVTPSVEKPT